MTKLAELAVINYMFPVYLTGFVVSVYGILTAKEERRALFFVGTAALFLFLAGI